MLDIKKIYNLSVHDFKSEYSGSVLGSVWSLLQPLFYILILWFFFTKAIKFKPAGGVGYVPWLICAMAAWNFFSIAIGRSVGLIDKYTHLIKANKITIPELILARILSAQYFHLMFLGIVMIVVLGFAGVELNFKMFYLIFFNFILILFIVPLGLIISILQKFIKDTVNIVGVILNMCFWLSPIFWDIANVPEKYRDYVKLNPLYFPISGYRKSIIYPQELEIISFSLGYYALVCILTSIIAYLFYKKLRPHIGDVI